MQRPVQTPMIESDYRPSGKPFTGRRMLITILLFFAVIITANMTMLFSALGSFGGLLVKNSYVASQRFNNDIADDRSSAIAAWSVSAQVREAPGGGALLIATVSDETGAAIDALSLDGLIGRPTHERDDEPLVFTRVAEGAYSAALAGDASKYVGAWRVILRDSETGASRRLNVFQKSPAG